MLGERLARHADADVDVTLRLLDEALPLGFRLGLDAALLGGDLLDAFRAQRFELGRQGLQPAVELGELGGGRCGGLARGFEAAANLLCAAGEMLGQGRPQQVDEAADEDGEIEEAGDGGPDAFVVGGLGAVAGTLGAVRARGRRTMRRRLAVSGVAGAGRRGRRVLAGSGAG